MSHSPPLLDDEADRVCASCGSPKVFWRWEPESFRYVWSGPRGRAFNLATGDPAGRGAWQMPVVLLAVLLVAAVAGWWLLDEFGWAP